SVFKKITQPVRIIRGNDEFSKHMEKISTKYKDVKWSKNLAYGLLEDDLKNLSSKTLGKPFSGMNVRIFNLKIDIYRVFTVFIDSLALYFEVDEPAIKNKIAALEGEIFDKEFCTKLKYFFYEIIFF